MKVNKMASKLNKLPPSDLPEDDKDEEGRSTVKAGPSKEGFRITAFWKDQVDNYEQGTRKWVKRSNNIVKRFRDERSKVEEGATRRMNYLWANTMVMMPAIFSSVPIPIVDRKFLDSDPVGRLSSQILERSLKNEIDSNGFFDAMNKCVLDKLLSGRGTAWVRYVPEFGEGESLPGYTPNGVEDALEGIHSDSDIDRMPEEDEKEEQLEQTNEQVIAEKTEVDYIDWRDFYYFPIKARTWSEVQAVGKRIHISRQEAVEFFGKEIGRKLRPDTTPMGTGQTPNLDYSETSVFSDVNERTIVVYEVWNKSDKKVYWFSTGYEYLCRVEDDPLELTGFFPCPPPLFSTLTNDTLIPVPDYHEWQDQAIQIDELTQRLAMLAKACKVAGAYASNAPAIKRLLEESCENELLPVDQWASFQDMGGLEGAVSYLPIDQIQKTIETLQKVRQQVQIDLDQMTGLSDVIRGTTDSRETLGGLRLKNNNAGTRLSKSQAEVARFCRDIIFITAEIICKHFSDEAIIESSGILYEDALQPDTVLREWKADHGMDEQPAQGPQQPQGAPQSANQVPGVPMPPPTQPAAQGQPPMPGMLANPMAGMPGATGQQNNVIPFPGATPDQPSMDMGGGQPQNIGMGGIGLMEPILPDPTDLIAEKVSQAIELLRNDLKRNYRIDIETDSTIFGDKYQERQDATEFIAALGAFIKQFGESSQGEPLLMPLAGKGLQWATRKWRVGRDLEAELDTFVAEMTKKAKLLKDQPQSSPEEKKVEAQIKIEQHKAQMQEENDKRDHARMERDDNRQFQMDMHKDQREKEKMEMEMQLERERMQMEREKMQLEIQLMKAKHQLEMQKMQMDAQVKTHQANVEQQTSQMEMQHEHERMGMERENMQAEHEQSQREHEMSMEQNAQQHKQKMQQTQEAGKVKNQQMKEQGKIKAQQMKKPKKKAS